MNTQTISESQGIIQENLDYTLFSWSKQKGINPIAVQHADPQKRAFCPDPEGSCRDVCLRAYGLWQGTSWPCPVGNYF